MQHLARYARRPFPRRPGLIIDPDAGSRLEMGRRLGIDPDFLHQQPGIAHDVDGDALVVRGEACDHEDCFFTIPADPLGRRAPELDGELPLSVWYVSGSPWHDTPAIIGLDLESVCNAELACCAASMLCVPGPCLDDWSTADWSRHLQQGAACLILERHHKAKALILASHPGNSAAARAYPALAEALGDLGYHGPILELPELDLRPFVSTALCPWIRAATFIGHLGALLRPSSVPPDSLLPSRLDHRP